MILQNNDSINTQRPEIFLISVYPTSPRLHLGIASLVAYLKERDIKVRQAALGLPSIKGIKSLSLLQEERQVFFQEMIDFINDKKSANTLSEGHRTLKMVLMIWANYLLRENPHSLGFSVNLGNVGLVLLLSKIIKKQKPNLLIIFGGPECNSVNGKIFLNMKYADIIIEGEGEETLYEILCRFKEKSNITIPCKITTEKESTYLHGTAPLCIDSLPPPDYEDIFNKKSLIHYIPVAFNRGCSFRCTFCNERKFWKTFRQMKIENAMAYIEKLEHRYGVGRYFLHQSLMNNDIKWLKNFSAQLCQSEINVRWGGNARIRSKMDEDFFTTLYRGGCRFFHWGIESGSKSVLKSMQKGVTPQINKRILQLAASNGFWNHTYWIFGFPTETETDLLSSVDFILENSEIIHSAIFHIYSDMDKALDNEINPIDVIDYYLIRGKRNKSNTSELIKNYRGFFICITKIMRFYPPNGEHFGDYLCRDLAISEDKLRMLAAAHLLRFFIVEPGERDEITRILNKEAFQKAFQHLVLQKVTLKEIMALDSPIGKDLFYFLKKI